MSLGDKYNVDIGEILGGDFNQPILAHDMYCPMISNKREKKRNNWNKKQCELRVRISAPCTAACPIGIDIKANYERIGEPYLDNFYEVPVSTVMPQLNCGGIKTTDYLGNWGTSANIKRNVNIVTDYLNGIPWEKITDKYNMTKPNSKAILRRYCRLANKKIYDSFDKNTSEKIKFLMVNKHHFLPYLPKGD